MEEMKFNKMQKNKDSNMKNACNETAKRIRKMLQILCKVCKRTGWILLIFGPTSAW